MRLTAAAAFVVALFAGVDASLQTPAGGAEGSPLRRARIDAVVTSNGRFLGGLTAADFEILEDGVARPVEEVTAVGPRTTLPASDAIPGITSREAEQSEAGRVDTRLFAVFLDDYHVTDGDGA